MLKKLALVAAALGLAVAGCSASANDGPSAQPETASASPAVEESPEPEPERATTEQWASKVARAQTGFVDAMDSWEEGDCLPSDEEAVCSIMLSTIGISALTLSIEIESGTNDGAEGFIGDPPAEIASLVSETYDLAIETNESVEDANACDSDCMAENVEAITAARQLVSVLNGWSPYM